MKNKEMEERIKQIFEADNEEELEANLKVTQELRFRNFGKTIRFYVPSFMYYQSGYYRSSPTDFPTISVTGKHCSLRCKHCGGKVLNTMYSVTTPEKLFELCTQLKQRGSLGCLISGGCLPDGSVPLKNFIDTIKEIKHKLDLTLIVHTGVIDFEAAENLRNAGIDTALIDIIGSDKTIREIYRLNTTVEAYEKSLEALDKAGMPYVPHVIVGLHYGRLKGELHALRMISRHNPSALVVIAFMPIHRTDMESVAPPNPVDIAKVIATARLMFPKTPLALGCMRPKGEHRIKTDILAIKAGVNAIAFPTTEAIAFIKKLGHEITFSSLCCSQVYTET